MRSVSLLIASLLATSAIAEDSPYVGVIFEFAVARDGSRQNIRIVSIEQPVTHEDLSSALTQAEKSRGIHNISRRPRLSAKDIGHTLYEVAIFDLRVRRYITDEK